MKRTGGRDNKNSEGVFFLRYEHRKNGGKEKEVTESKGKRKKYRKEKSINKNPTFVETRTLRMRWSRFAPVAWPSLEIVYKARWEGPGYRCAERFDGHKRGCEGNIWLVQVQNVGNLEGVVSDAARHHIHSPDWCVQQVPLGSDRLKKKVWSTKASSSGGRLVFLFLCTAGPEGMSCNALPVHDGFLFFPRVSNYGF